MASEGGDLFRTSAQHITEKDCKSAFVWKRSIDKKLPLKFTDCYQTNQTATFNDGENGIIQSQLQEVASSSSSGASGHAHDDPNDDTYAKGT
jgi:hypothetical protein